MAHAVRMIPASRGRRRRAVRPAAGWATGGWCALRQCWWIEASLVLRTASTLNAREHWRRRSGRSQQERLSAAAAITGRLERRDSAPPLEEFQTALAGSGPVHVVARLVRIAPRSLDVGDNLAASLKAVRDGVADALGLANDRDPRVRGTYDQNRWGPREYAVSIELQLYAGAKALEMRGESPAQEVEDGQRNEGTHASSSSARGTSEAASQTEAGRGDRRRPTARSRQRAR